MNTWVGRILESPETKDMDLPGFPPESTQELFVGRSGRAALEEVAPFYRIICGAAAITQTSKVLDFGVGWGRIARFFQGQMGNCDGLYLADVDQGALDLCSACRVKGEAIKLDPNGGLPFESGFLDIAYAYSVFSHLSEAAARRWLEELARCLKPGGVLVFTTTSMRFLNLVQACHDKIDANEVEQRIGQYMGSDPSAAVMEFKRGKFAFSGTGGGGVLTGDFYGWAAMPPSWLPEQIRSLAILDYIDNPAVSEQAVFVARKR